MPVVSLAKVFQDSDSFATTLVAALLDTYGTEALEWHPETIYKEITEDFNVKMEPALFDRLMAGILLLTTDRFYRSVPDFIAICNVLSGATLDADSFDPADAAECAWGITEGLLLSPPDEEDENPFSQEIVGYVQAALQDEGIMVPPDILRLGFKEDANWERVQADFVDDPEMFAGIWDAEQSKTQEIDQLVKQKLMAMLQQLQSLSLTNGDTQAIAEKMLVQLKGN